MAPTAKGSGIETLRDGSNARSIGSSLPRRDTLRTFGRRPLTRLPMTGRSPASPSLLSTNIVLRLVVYYGGLAIVGGGIWAVSPPAIRQALGDTFAPILNADTFGG